MFKELKIRLQDIKTLLNQAPKLQKADLEYLQKEVAELKQIIEGLKS